MVRRRFLSEKQIQQIAADKIAEYRRMVDNSLSLPISAEKVAIQLLNIFPEWESFGPNKQQILGKAISARWGKPARIVLNEDCLDGLFDTTPHLENTVIGHELGHIVLHFDPGKQYQMDLGIEEVGGINVTTASIVDPLRFQSSDDLWREWQAHTFMRHLLVPEQLLKDVVEGRLVESWTDVGVLAEDFNVTKTVMKIQLEKSGLMRRDALTDYYSNKAEIR